MKPHEYIKRTRLIAGKNQAQAAEVINTSRSNYTHKETGRSPITAEEFFMLVEAFKGSTQDIEDIKKDIIPRNTATPDGIYTKLQTLSQSDLSIVDTLVDRLSKAE